MAHRKLCACGGWEPTFSKFPFPTRRVHEPDDLHAINTSRKDKSVIFIYQTIV